MHILYEVAKRYPQLLLPIEEGISQSEAFRDAVLRGNPVDREPDFSFAAGDRLTSCDTPAGRAEILFLENRDDFVHAYRALGYRCEPADIPPSVGAATVPSCSQVAPSSALRTAVTSPTQRALPGA